LALSLVLVTGCETHPDTSQPSALSGKLDSGCFTLGRSSKPRLHDWKENEVKRVAPSSEPECREQDIMGQAYQVIGAIASEAGLLDHPEVQRALDYFSENRYREDFLPFCLLPLITVNGKLETFNKNTSGDS